MRDKGKELLVYTYYTTQRGHRIAWRTGIQREGGERGNRAKTDEGGKEGEEEKKEETNDKVSGVEG